MRAGYYTGGRTYEVREIPDREPKDDEVKIEVAWCGLCGTDLHKFEGKNGAGPVVPPIILGHECSGIVSAVGPEVQYYKPGDRVAADPSYGCGKCSYCQQGLPNFCLTRHGVAKGFSDYVYPPEKNVYKVSEKLDLRDAAFAEPLSCVLHGLDLIRIRSGSTVAVYGLGSVGSLMLQMVKLSGASVIIAIEREKEKQKLALSMGADYAVDDRQIENLAGHFNIDYVIECIGLKSTMEQSLKIAGKNAKVLLFGLGDPDQPMVLDQFEAYTKELSIYTSYLNPNTTKRAVALLESGRLDTSSIISASLDLEEMGEELETRRNARRGKVMVRLSGKH